MWEVSVRGGGIGRKWRLSTAAMTTVGALTVSTVGLASAEPAGALTRTLTTCDQASFKAAVAKGGTVLFGVPCGLTLTSPVTIGSTLTVDIEGNGNSVHLSGGGSTRQFVVNGGNLTIGGIELQQGVVSASVGASGGPGGQGALGVIGSTGAAGTPGGGGQPGGKGRAGGLARGGAILISAGRCHSQECDLVGELGVGRAGRRGRPRRGRRARRQRWQWNFWLEW